VQDISNADKVCFFAHFHPDNIVTSCVLHYLLSLRDAGFAVVAATASCLSSSDLSKLREVCDDVIIRDNVGHDFGSWMACYEKWSPERAEFLLLCNDSVYGPLTDLQRTIERLTAVNADVYGMVASLEIEPHVQSWFVLMRPAAYKSTGFRQLMASRIDRGVSKDEIISRYELGLSRCFRSEGLRVRALYDPAEHGLVSRLYPGNATHLLWRQLICDFGVPFLKVELLRDNPWRVSDFEEWPTLVKHLCPELLQPMLDDIRARQRARSICPPDTRYARSPVNYYPPFRRHYLVDQALTRSENKAPRHVNAAIFRARRLIYLLVQRVGGRLRRSLSG
jgi:hypothetical protein